MSQTNLKETQPTSELLNPLPNIKQGLPSLKKEGDPPLSPQDDDLENAEYEQLSCQSGEEDNQGLTQREIPIPGPLNGFRGEMEKKAKQLNLTCYFQEAGQKKIILTGEGYALEEFSGYLQRIKTIMEKNFISKLGLGEFVQKVIPLTSSFHHFAPLINQVAETLELVIEHDQTKMTVHGYDRRVKEFMAFLFEKEVEYDQGQLISQEINISTFQRRYVKQIEAHGKTLGLELEFGYDMIMVRGARKPIDRLILYLMALETKVKKAMFPKYWDFKNNSPLALIPVEKDTEEWKYVAKPFHDTIGNANAKINWIKRVQNKYLMDQFITVINKRMEQNPGEPINRLFLFHGTKQNNPEKIYGNFDTGFDLQYAAFGSHGKGLYFAKRAQYSDGGYVFNTPEGTKQFFLADVFVGKSFNGGHGGNVRAPVGYDSENAGGEFYIIYHNFYSYPLYLIDYTTPYPGVY